MIEDQNEKFDSLQQSFQVIKEEGAEIRKQNEKELEDAIQKLDSFS